MNQNTRIWLHEARTALAEVETRFTQINSITATACGQLCAAAEMGLKAIVVEREGGVPTSFYSHDLVNIAVSTKLWPLLPERSQTTLTALSPFNPNVRYPSERAYATLVNSPSPEMWEQRLKDTRHFIDFCETVVTDVELMKKLR